MKALWASVILFLVMLGIILGNAAYIHYCSDHLRTLIKQLNASPSKGDALSLMDAFWKRNRGIVELSVGSRGTDSITETLNCLRWAYETDNKAEFLKYTIILENKIEEMERAEFFSVDSLF